MMCAGCLLADAPDDTQDVLAEVLQERYRQNVKWGEQNHPDGTGGRLLQLIAATARTDCQIAAHDGELTWRHILREEVQEAFAEEDETALRAELIQVAAVAEQWVEALDRRTALRRRDGDG